ncbi:MAG: hypothetical protein NVSMB12_01480 [Acidimicrobiales bacterium]
MLSLSYRRAATLSAMGESGPWASIRIVRTGRVARTWCSSPWPSPSRSHSWCGRSCERANIDAMSSSLSPAVPQVDPEEGARLVEAGALLLDVREPDEWMAGHAPAAAHLPLGEVPLRSEELPTDRQVVAICRAGGRSQQAAEFLRQRGVDAVNLAGGMRAWHAAGLDVVTDDGTGGTVI